MNRKGFSKSCHQSQVKQLSCSDRPKQKGLPSPISCVWASMWKIIRTNGFSSAHANTYVKLFKTVSCAVSKQDTFPVDSCNLSFRKEPAVFIRPLWSSCPTFAKLDQGSVYLASSSAHTDTQKNENKASVGFAHPPFFSYLCPSVFLLLLTRSRGDSCAVSTINPKSTRIKIAIHISLTLVACCLHPDLDIFLSVLDCRGPSVLHLVNAQSPGD